MGWRIVATEHFDAVIGQRGLPKAQLAVVARIEAIEVGRALPASVRLEQALAAAFRRAER